MFSYSQGFGWELGLGGETPQESDDFGLQNDVDLREEKFWGEVEGGGGPS